MIGTKPLSLAGLSLGLVGLLTAATPLLSGCDTKAYCFANCGDSTTTGTGTSAGGNGGAGGQMFSTSTGFADSSSSGQGGCAPTNGGIEACDHIDNDCNGQVDDISGNDYTKPKTCGTCDNNCLALPGTNWDGATVTCTLPANAVPGVTPGTCAGSCTTDYYDISPQDGKCEYYCVKNPSGATTDTICDAKDDDCDGLIDEDVNLCTSLTDCGKCGGNCVVLNGTPKCTNNGMMPCGPMNTKCEIAGCDPGWVDLDQSYATGCEYQCTPNGPEVCGDGIDNDCNGFIDSNDPNIANDPQIGVVCFGGTQGECATAAHSGLTACVANSVDCVGANVLHPGDAVEMCDLKDNNCDGVVDNNPADAGSACGTNNTFPCKFGQNQCQNGVLVCVGAINPTTEKCNGQDDNCDMQIDLTNGQPPSDAVGACNVPVPPPVGATSPCMAGTKACVGGTVQCQNSKGPTQATDKCGDDSNCNGILENQPNKMTDVHNCGTCGNDCTTGAVNANWSCQTGTCHFDGCVNGFFDLNNDQKCEYACTFVSAVEACNGQDDNCNGTVDEGAVAPSPVSICGVSPLASTPECTSGVQVACTAGAWKCTFPAGVCTGAAPNQCAGTSETCDALDNNCNGFVNETSPNYGKTCASDDGKPPPGDGACRTVGTRICDAADPAKLATKCSAVTASCASLPGGCTEKCDGIDNDCDGSIDEPYSSKGTNAANFYKPAVVKLGANLWMYEYEASRPKSTNVVPGTGNGYFSSAPVGTTIDKTPSCSEPSKIPWFNVTADEVEQTCSAMGGFICTLAEWQQACHVKAPNCTFGYNAYGAACTSAYTATKYCNIGPSYDFDPLTAGDQDGLLPTASAALGNCWADWSSINLNPANNKIFDITGNLREIVSDTPGVYRLMGGAFDSAAESGSTCDFSFYAVDNKFKFFDTGFRCCFGSDPTL